MECGQEWPVPPPPLKELAHENLLSNSHCFCVPLCQQWQGHSAALHCDMTGLTGFYFNSQGIPIHPTLSSATAHRDPCPLTGTSLLPQRGGRAEPSDLGCDVVVDGGPCVQAAVKCSLGTPSEDDVPIQTQGLGQPQLEGNSTTYSLQQLRSAQRLQTSVRPTRGPIPERRELRPAPGCATFPHVEIGHGADPLSAVRPSG